VAEQPLLSTVITSYTTDRLKDIFELLDSIKAQTYNHIETILVIERSMELSDQIKQYVEERAIPSVKAVFNHGEPGLSAARNLGVKEAGGDIIAFIDDDALPSPNWAEEMVKTYQDKSVIGATGPVLPLWKDEPVEWFPDELDWILSCAAFSGITSKKEVRNVFGTNMSFRRDAFDSSGLFLTHLGAKGGGETGKHELVGDETEFSIRVKRRTGKHILYNPNIKAWHKVYKYRVTSPVIARRAYWEGYTKAMFNKNYRNSGTKEKLLDVEYQLLRRILGRLLPGILMGFFKHPIIAWRKLSVTITALSFVAFGYFSYLCQSFRSRKEVTVGRQAFEQRK
jgi:GT2 family glycosyltransferase